MSGVGASLRPLEVADAEAFRDLRLAALLDAPEAFGSTYARERDWPAARHAERLTSSVAAMGAFAGARLVAFAGVFREGGPKVSHKGVLWGVHVDPAWRGRGLGAEVVGGACEAVPEGVEQIHLTCTATNLPALALYERLGFHRYGVEPRSLKAADGYHDEVLMVLMRGAAKG